MLLHLNLVDQKLKYLNFHIYKKHSPCLTMQPFPIVEYLLSVDMNNTDLKEKKSLQILGRNF